MDSKSQPLSSNMKDVLGGTSSEKRKAESLGESKRSIKRKRSKTAKEDVDDNFDLERGVNSIIGHLDSHLLADYVAQRTKRFEPGLTIVEFEDRHISAKAFEDTSKFDKPRTLENLPDFLRSSSSRFQKKQASSPASKSNGSPHTLVVAAAGLRAAEITRALRPFQTQDAIVAKLFAKHIKLKEALKYVQKTSIGIGVGTPSRIVDLLNAGALSAHNLERVIIDASHIDPKKRGILDMKETQQPLIRLLNRAELKSRFGKEHDGIQLLFY